MGSTKLTWCLQEYQDGRLLSEDATTSFVLTLELVYRKFLVKQAISILSDIVT